MKERTLIVGEGPVLPEFRYQLSDGHVEVVPGDQVEWASDRPEVCLVDHSGVMAMSEGSAIITATHRGQTAQCRYNVRAIPQPVPPPERLVPELLP